MQQYCSFCLSGYTIGCDRVCEPSNAADSRKSWAVWFAQGREPLIASVRDIEHCCWNGHPRSSVDVAMPELSRFYGIIIRMYCELGPHHSPHFHAYHGDDEAVYGLDPIELLAGSLPRRQARLAEAWAELHQSELVADWGRLQAGSEPLPIDPLP